MTYNTRAPLAGDVTLRQATPEDVPAIFRLVQELAAFEQAADEVENTEDRLRQDGFGEPPLFRCFVAEEAGVVVGMALVYFRYSTWKGRCLYLEDLVVTKAHQKRGIGKLLMDGCIAYAQETGSRLLVWQVLDWNTPAIEFYKSLGAQLKPGWVNCVLPI